MVIVAGAGVAAAFLLLPGGPTAVQGARLLRPADPGREHGPFRVGDTVALGPYAITAKGVTDRFTVAKADGPRPTSGTPTPPGDRLVRVDVAVANRTGSTLSLDFGSFAVRGQNGHDYLALLSVSGARLIGKRPASGKLDLILGPGNRAAGYVVAALPTRVRALWLVFSPFRNEPKRSGQTLIAL